MPKPLLTDEAKAVLARLKQNAETSGQLTFAEVVSQKLVPRSHVDDVIVDGVVWFVGYGIEQNLIGPEQWGKVRHLSISHHDRKTLPSPDVVLLLTEQLGFGDLHNDTQASVTMYQKRGLTAHILQTIKPEKPQ